jgi:hypothetical protein
MLYNKIHINNKSINKMYINFNNKRNNIAIKISKRIKILIMSKLLINRKIKRKKQNKFLKIKKP